MKIIQKIRVVLASFALSLVVLTPVWADDTEIFFGGARQTGSADKDPNVLFILDTSGSMSSSVGSTGQSRMDNLKSAMHTILDASTGINVGLMRFSNPGGPILYPISPIDDDICNIEDCAAGGTGDGGTDPIQAPLSGSVSGVYIHRNTDDAEEHVLGDSNAGIIAGQVRLYETSILVIEDIVVSGPLGNVTKQISQSANDAQENMATNTLDLTNTTLSIPLHITGVHAVTIGDIHTYSQNNEIPSNDDPLECNAATCLIQYETDKVDKHFDEDEEVIYQDDLFCDENDCRLYHQSGGGATTLDFLAKPSGSDFACDENNGCKVGELENEYNTSRIDDNRICLGSSCNVYYNITESFSRGETITDFEGTQAKCNENDCRFNEVTTPLGGIIPAGSRCNENDCNLGESLIIDKEVIFPDNSVCNEADCKIGEIISRNNSIPDNSKCRDQSRGCDTSDGRRYWNTIPDGLSCAESNCPIGQTIYRGRSIPNGQKCRENDGCDIGETFIVYNSREITTDSRCNENNGCDLRGIIIYKPGLIPASSVCSEDNCNVLYRVTKNYAQGEEIERISNQRAYCSQATCKLLRTRSDVDKGDDINTNRYCRESNGCEVYEEPDKIDYRLNEDDKLPNDRTYSCDEDHCRFELRPITTFAIGSEITSSDEDRICAQPTCRLKTPDIIGELITELNDTGLRFVDIEIPEEKKITEAIITFTSSGMVTNANAAYFDVYVESPDQGQFSEVQKPGNRVARSAILGPVKCSITDNNNAGVAYTQTCNVTDLVQLAYDEVDWDHTSDILTFLIHDDASKDNHEGSTRFISSADSSSSLSPLLMIDYEDEDTGEVAKRVVGLRFQNVAIPTGSTVSSARIVFRSINGSSGNADWEIWAVDSSAPSVEEGRSAATFGGANGSLSALNTLSEKVDWAVDDWNNGEKSFRTTVDISNIIQEVVSKSNWCGNNAISLIIKGTGTREFYTYEMNPAKSAELQFSFTNDDVNACHHSVVTQRLLTDVDDATEKANVVTVREESMDFDADTKLGFRFADVNIPQNATIYESDIEFGHGSGASAAFVATIKGENQDNSSTYLTEPSNISDRTLTDASVVWSESELFEQGVGFTTPNLQAITQIIVEREGWFSNHIMNFIIEPSSGGANLIQASTYTSANADEPASVQHIPTLRIKFSGGQDPDPPIIESVRDRLKSEVDKLEPSGWTPIVDTFYEAALYYKGQPVKYGKVRGGPNEQDSGPFAYTGISHENSYTGGTGVFTPNNCTADNPRGWDCRNEEITGDPVYISPIADPCALNTIILLTDGAPTANDNSKVITLVQEMAGINSCVTTFNGNNYSDDYRCGTELADYLYTNDQSITNDSGNDTIDGIQRVTTNTIAFNLTDTRDTGWLTDIANKGGGTAYNATNAADLVAIFADIIESVLSVDTSFVSPSSSINQFQRLSHQNNLYFSMFRATEEVKWFGNLKKYNLKFNTILGKEQLVDADDLPAVDPTTLFFKQTARSVWSATDDGFDVDAGGAASNIPAIASRNIFINMGASDTLTAAGNLFKIDNSGITKTLLGIDSETNQYREDLISWIRGYDFLDVRENTDQRQQYGDPLHSNPVVVTYGGTEDAPDDTIFFSTNEGFLHAIDADDGVEQFVWTPKTLLANHDKFFGNKGGEHVYGLDGSPKIWRHDDADDNTISGADDFVYLYQGMRRGGRNYYGLDVTSRTAPKMLWTVEGGTGDYTELGQTWADSVRTKVKIDGVVKTVLVVSGGYDEAFDFDTGASTPTRNLITATMGRAIFMIDAHDGSRIWSSADSNAGAGFSDMIYSIPSNVRVVDVNLDGFADQMYFGDLGGQVWRMDVVQETANVSAANLVKGGVIADLGADDSGIDYRRFFYAPDVAIVGGKLIVTLGSGWRAHPLVPFKTAPLDQVINDRFYVLKSADIFNAPASYTKLTHNDLFDATSGTTPDPNNGDDATNQENNGFYITFDSVNGEKALSSPLVAENKIFFTTFLPGQSSIGACSAVAGSGRLYALNASDGNPVYDLGDDQVIGDNEVLTLDDRYTNLGTGIPPSPQLVFPSDSDTPILMVGPATPIDPKFDNNRGRTYWREATK